MLQLGALNPEQREAVRTTEGPVLILAGAGTGKTRVITSRIAYLIEKGVPQGDILGVTFTNKAAREMRERVSTLLPRRRRKSSKKDKEKEKADRATICTFHSLCARILREHIEKLGYKRNFVIYSESEQLATVRKVLSHISAKGEKTDPRMVLSLISKHKNAGGGATFSDPNSAVLADMALKRYQSALKASNAVDFDDLIGLALRIFEEHPEALEACRRKYRYVMVDEYQDTNGAQFQLVNMLTQEHRNLCVVGDDDQSIYGWRGAEISNLLDLEKHFPEVKVIKLEQNYRSTSMILNAANAVIKNNPRRRPKNLWSDEGEGTPILLQTFDSDEDEAQGVVDEIEFNRISRKIPWEDHAILLRTNGQARALETALRKEKIRYHLVGGLSYFDRREIKDFLSFLRTIVNPHDEVSLLRIVNVPARGLSDVTMERLLSHSQERSCSVYAAMKHTDVLDAFLSRARDAITEFVTLIGETQARLDSEPDLTLSAWAEDFLGEIGYWDELRRSEKNVETAENRVRNLKDLVKTLDEYAPGRTKLSARLGVFLEDITLDSERESEKDESGDAVTLITMHSCKGLEYPHVFIVGMEDGLLPHARSKEEGTLDEERRLFYVAITRAKKSLSITHCQTRREFGQSMPCHPSPFLKELPEELVERAEDRPNEPVTEDEGKGKFDALRASLQ
jgi:DNA helicase II / ATP-dependent DNA helicase PcrA